MSFIRNLWMGCVCGVFWGLTSQAEGVDFTQRFTLAQFLKLSLENGPVLDEARAQTEFSKARESLAQSFSWPQLKFDYLVGAVPDAQGNALEGRQNFSSWGVSQGVAAEMSVPIYTFGALSSAREAAKKGTEAEFALLKQKELALRLRVAEIYFGFQLAFEFVELTSSLNKQLGEALAKAQKIKSLKATDLDKLQVAQWDVQARQLEAEKAWDLMRSAMAWHLGCQGTHQCRPQWDSASLGERKTIELPEDLAPLWQEAQKSRPELIAARRNVEARSALLESESSRLWPVIFAGIQVQKSWTPGRVDQLSPFAYDPLNELKAVGGVGLRWNLSVFEKSAQRALAAAELLKAEAVLRNAQEALKADFDRAAGELKFLNQTLELRKKSSRLSKKVFYDTLAQFVLGSGQAKDVLEALGLYALGEKARLESVFQKNVQEFKWAQVMGEEIKE